MTDYKRWYASNHHLITEAAHKSVLELEADLKSVEAENQELVYDCRDYRIENAALREAVRMHKDSSDPYGYTEEDLELWKILTKEKVEHDEHGALVEAAQVLVERMDNYTAKVEVGADLHAAAISLLFARGRVKALLPKEEVP